LMLEKYWLKMTLNLNEPSKIEDTSGLNQSNTLVFGGK
jgi:hypothetical protein